MTGAIYGAPAPFTSMKTCTKCGELKPLGDYHKRAASKDGHKYICKACSVEEHRAWKAAQPAGRLSAMEKSWRDNNPRREIERRLLRKYGISHDEFTAMVLQQDGQCAICHKVPPKLVVDHDHETGAVRQLLCGNCNRALGMLQDQPHLADRAADYLRTHA